MLRLSAVAAAFLLCNQALGAVVDFEDLSLAPNSYYNGSNGAGAFVSRGATFNNSFTDFGGGFTTWAGWAYSNATDNTIAGYGNQYSAFPGGGSGGSAVYGVSYVSAYDAAPEIVLPTGYRPVSIDLTNTTYSALIMRDGDPLGYAKKFGGVGGSDPDYFKLTITGLNASNQPTGSLEFYLADFRFADDAQDYIVSDWRTVDLTGLGAATKLNFALTSTDFDPLYGPNTPTYFAADNLTVAAVPEAGGLALAGAGVVTLIAVRRKRRRR